MMTILRRCAAGEGKLVSWMTLWLDGAFGRCYLEGAENDMCFAGNADNDRAQLYGLGGIFDLEDTALGRAVQVSNGGAKPRERRTGRQAYNVTESLS